MIYEETQWKSRISVPLMILLLLLAYSPWLMNCRELFFDEGFYAALVNGVSGIPPVVTVNGQFSNNGFPLFPLLAKAMQDLGFCMETSLRLISFSCMLMLAGIVALTCKRAMGTQAALAGVSAMMATIIMGDKYAEGNPILLGTLGIFSAWMLWFDLGVSRGQWRPAWIIFGWIAGLTFYAIGWFGLIMLILPMIPLRRPLNIWGKPRGSAFVTGALLLAIFILIWGFPRWNNGVFNRDLLELRMPTLWKYIKHLLIFPFDAAFRFMPWTLFAWAPFCPALQTLDKTPLLSRYLRTLFLGTFLLLWLSPFTEGRDIVLAVPSLAVLIGCSYWIVVRRYGWRLLELCSFFAFFSFFISLGSLALMTLPENVLKVILPSSFDLSFRTETLQNSIIGILYPTLGCITSGIVWIMARHGAAVWLTSIVLFLSFMLPNQGVMIPYKSSNNRHSILGKNIGNHIDSPDKNKVILYKFDTLPRLYAELHYAGVTVKSIHTERELPDKDQTIYVLSSVVPSAPERLWKQLYNTNYKNIRLELWKGERKKIDYADE